MALTISSKLSLPMEEIELSAVRAQGPGGQNVNKVAAAVHLRFDIAASSLPIHLKTKLLTLSDQRVTKDGVVVIKAQAHRSLERNREDALLRLRDFIALGLRVTKARRPTAPSRTARKKRVDRKTRRGKIKTLRKKVSRED
jgi:ribosome-associated protein